MLIALLPDDEPALGVARVRPRRPRLLGAPAADDQLRPGGAHRLRGGAAGGVIAFYQLGYGIAAFGVGPLHDAGVELPTVYALAADRRRRHGRWSFVVAGGGRARLHSIALAGARAYGTLVPRSAPIAPSGEQIEIALGDQRAVIVEVGGGLRSYSAGGRELLDGYGADEMCTSGRGQVLIPWPNRLRGRQLRVRRAAPPAPARPSPTRGNAIHGLVRWASWTVAEREPDRVVMEHLLHPQPGYPFSLALSIEYALSEQRTVASGRRQPTSAAKPCPYGAARTRT